jgi:acyl-CoA reductase-like NAD-dependent aldehyde dehydrogenase
LGSLGHDCGVDGLDVVDRETDWVLRVGSSGARAMIDSPDVPVINLPGSSKTGQAIMAACAKNMKRFGGELGGKTPVLLFDDADLDKALPKVEKALTVFAGQFCMTGSRLLVHRPILDIVRKRLAVRLEAIKRSGLRSFERYGAADQYCQCQTG